MTQTPLTTTAKPTSSISTSLLAVARHKVVWPLAALALIFLIDFLISPNFFSIRIVEGRLFGSVIDIFYRAVPTAMVALGMAVVIGTKGIDLSVGSIIAIVGAVITWRIHAGDPHLLILFWALGVGLLCGMWNGFLVAALDIPADHRDADPDGLRPRHRADDQPALRRHQSELHQRAAAGHQHRALRLHSDPAAGVPVGLRRCCGRCCDARRSGCSSNRSAATPRRPT